MLEDEVAQGPAGNPAACKLGINLCNLLLAAMTDRETTIAKVQANDKTDIDASAQNFFDQSVTTTWTARANGIRTEAESVYDQFRTAARPSLSALHGKPASGGQETAAERIFSQPPPAPVAQSNSSSKPVVFSAGGGGPGDFQVISAFYGADKKKVDVSNLIRRHIADNELHMSESDWEFGNDPAPGKRKNLTIVYYANGEEKTFKSDHRQEILLP